MCSECIWPPVWLLPQPRVVPVEKRTWSPAKHPSGPVGGGGGGAGGSQSVTLGRGDAARGLCRRSALLLTCTMTPFCMQKTRTQHPCRSSKGDQLACTSGRAHAKLHCWQTAPWRSLYPSRQPSMQNRSTPCLRMMVNCWSSAAPMPTSMVAEVVELAWRPPAERTHAHVPW